MALMDYMRAKAILDKYKIRSVPSRYVSSAEQAVSFAGRDSIALKLLSDKVLHKSRAGLVKLNLSGAGEIGRAFGELKRKGRGIRQYRIIAQKMAKPGVEAIIGGNTDPQIGKVLLLGLGGVYVEAFGDTQLRLCPITKYDAGQMIDGLRSKDILTGNGKSRDMLVELLMQASRLLTNNPRIKELDLNPVILRDGSYDAVDIRVLV
jgi:hypothetical protein